MMKIASWYGLVLGFVFVVLTLLGILSPLVSLIAYVGGIVYCTILYREKYSDGAISYGRSLLFGVLVSGFTFIILGVFTYVQMALHPDEFGQMFDAVVENMRARGYAAPEISENPMLNPAICIATYLFLGLFLGLAVAAITSIFTKKD
ncbi:MAG: DUF4199 domain-containing protein [Prevotellaceae bacterium]|nr:DUF4199 domain-containing protein [Prevotellaceae bacterium]